MPEYRLCFLNRQSGQIHSFERLEAPDDQTAIAAAIEMDPIKPAELWCGRRKLYSFVAQQKSICETLRPCNDNQPFFLQVDQAGDVWLLRDDGPLNLGPRDAACESMFWFLIDVRFDNRLGRRRMSPSHDASR